MYSVKSVINRVIVVTMTFNLLLVLVFDPINPQGNWGLAGNYRRQRLSGNPTINLGMMSIRERADRKVELLRTHAKSSTSSSQTTVNFQKELQRPLPQQ